MKTIKNIMTVLLCGLLIFGFSVFALVKAPHGYSLAERRSLAQLPDPSQKNLISGRFMADFETYSMDQFPLRDGFRSFKAVVSRYVFGQKDNHGLYVVNGMVSKLEYPLNKAKAGISAKKIKEIRTTYLDGTECKAYLSIIPDKNFYLAPLGGYPVMDLDRMVSLVKDGSGVENYIDITDMLSLEAFYNTDQHWRQEAVVPVAEAILQAMKGSDVRLSKDDFTENVLDHDFYGAYVGQSALPFDADTIHYLTNETLDGCTVTSYNSGMAQEAYLYDMSKAYGRDPYEMFLSGSDPLLIIEDPAAKTEKELVVFRDSFGSSLVPLMAGEYAKITVVDLRYIRSNMLADYLEFKDQDVLFLYSTLVLNNNISM